MPSLNQPVADQAMGHPTGISIDKNESQTNQQQSPLPTLKRENTRRHQQTLESFHLEPQDFQNFLLMNPPILEYSSSVFVNPNFSSGPGHITNNPTGIAGPAPYLSSPSYSNTTTANSSSQENTSGATTNDSNPDTDSNSSNQPRPHHNNFQNNEEFGHAFDPNFMNYNQQQQQQNFNNAQNHTQQENIDPHHQLQQQHQFQFFNPHYQQQQQQPSQFPDVTDNPMTLQQQQSFNFQLPQLKRRVSISNGQIGQISMMYQKNEKDPPDIHHYHSPQVGFHGMHHHSEAHPLQPGLSSQRPPDLATVPTDHPGKTKPKTTKFKPKQQVTKPSTQRPLKIESSIPPTNSNCTVKPTSTAIVDTEEIKVDQDGIPQHQLIYNNEIIFNPNNGPIPGTSAWKKQKILERNRIAASKCRQKKKVLQEKLQNDIDKLNKENQILVLKNKYLEDKLLGLKTDLMFFFNNQSQQQKQNTDFSLYKNLLKFFELQADQLYLEFKESLRLDDKKQKDEPNGDLDEEDDDDEEEGEMLNSNETTDDGS